MACVPALGGEQRVDIDPAGGKRADGLGVLAEIERELALQHLRAALGMDGELEGGQLGVVRRGIELALQLEGRDIGLAGGRLVVGRRRGLVPAASAGLLPGGWVGRLLSPHCAAQSGGPGGEVRRDADDEVPA